MSSDNQECPNRMTTSRVLTRVVSVSTVRVRYAEMSLNVQRQNKLLHSIWVNRAPCGSPGETDQHEYINIFQQHLLASAVDIFDNQKPNFIF